MFKYDYQGLEKRLSCFELFYELSTTKAGVLSDLKSDVNFVFTKELSHLKFDYWHAGPFDKFYLIDFLLYLRVDKTTNI